jgi:hypothetical protein
VAKPSPKAQHAFVEAYRAGLMQALGARAAARLSADEIYAGAMAVAARVDREIERMQRAGELKAVNTSYRDYRWDAAARGEKSLRYADWIDRYKANLIRDIAANLR